MTDIRGLEELHSLFRDLEFVGLCGKVLAEHGVEALAVSAYEDPSDAVYFDVQDYRSLNILRVNVSNTWVSKSLIRYLSCRSEECKDDVLFGLARIIVGAIEREGFATQEYEPD